MTMTPHDSQIVTITRTVVTQSCVHISPRICTIIRQLRIEVIRERSRNNLQQTLTSVSASAVHVHNLLIAVRDTARLRHDLIQHSVNLARVVSVETIATHSSHSHLAPRFTVPGLATGTKERANPLLHEVPRGLRQLRQHGAWQFANHARARPVANLLDSAIPQPLDHCPKAETSAATSATRNELA